MGITVCWHFIFDMITINHYPQKHRFSFENLAQAKSKQNLKMAATLRIWTSNVNETSQTKSFLKYTVAFRSQYLEKNPLNCF